MASIDIGIHPDPSGIGSRRFPDNRGGAFSTLDLDAGETHVSIFVSRRADLDALQAALDAIRWDMDMAAQTASDKAHSEEMRLAAIAREAVPE